ncbi:MAG TPA: cyclic nucleotide-binding domain-containing protein [Candidatus Binatia bacterium]
MDKETLLKNIYLFADATKEDLSRLLAIAEPRKFNQGELVFNEGDDADAMFIVEMGTVDMVPTGKEMVIVTIGTGQALGEVAFFRRGKRPGSARAKEMSNVLRIPFDRLEKLLTERPALALSFYRNACTFLSKHLRTLIKDVDRRYF